MARVLHFPVPAKSKRAAEIERTNERPYRGLHIAPYPSDAHGRGLHIAPWVGELGEIVLLAIRTDGRLAAAPLEVPWESDSLALAQELQATLDAADPPPIRLI